MWHWRRHLRLSCHVTCLCLLSCTAPYGFSLYCWLQSEVCDCALTARHCCAGHMCIHCLAGTALPGSVRRLGGLQGQHSKAVRQHIVIGRLLADMVLQECSTQMSHRSIAVSTGGQSVCRPKGCMGRDTFQIICCWALTVLLLAGQGRQGERHKFAAMLLAALKLFLLAGQCRHGHLVHCPAADSAKPVLMHARAQRTAQLPCRWQLRRQHQRNLSSPVELQARCITLPKALLVSALKLPLLAGQGTQGRSQVQAGCEGWRRGEEKGQVCSRAPLPTPRSVLGLWLPWPWVQQLDSYAAVRLWDAQLVLSSTRGLSYRQLTAACRQRAHLSVWHNTCLAQRPADLSRPYAACMS